MKQLHESLITLPNRQTFLQQIADIVNDDPFQTLMLIDVVRFSDVSCSFGHQLGDQILLDIANRINVQFERYDALLGRISGDVFALVIPGKYSKTRLYSFYTHLVDHFKTPIACDDHSFIADFNVGVVSNQSKIVDVNHFFARAETALKQAKNNRFENFCHLNIEDKVDTGRSSALKADLNRALSNQELELYFQPKVNLKSLQITGAECLLRWHHPLDGILFPGALIEAAESYNMMNDIGYWVLEEAFKAAKYLCTINGGLKLSVNMSLTQLYDRQFVTKLVGYSEKYQINLNQIELELTEDVALSHSFLVIKQLSTIQTLGVTIAIEDFGKSYTNLAYMRNIRIDTIKIDKTFVMYLDKSPINRAIVEATQLIAKSAGCAVVAEGIENIEHLHILREVGIVEGQGFLFSRAVPIKEFVALTEQDFSIGDSVARLSRGH
ncbi:MAG: diguanylate cyclase (GGDEF)-like protein [Paraglaciecola sp.]|jgi:diguanylate cyclase (GGDEF)-like protein